jgi:hypothetical protein
MNDDDITYVQVYIVKKMLSIFGVSIVLYFIKILSGSRNIGNYYRKTGQGELSYSLTNAKQQQVSVL